MHMPPVLLALRNTRATCSDKRSDPNGQRTASSVAFEVEMVGDAVVDYAN